MTGRCRAVVAARYIAPKTSHQRDIKLHKAGDQGERVHEQVISQRHLDLEQVQADESKVKEQGKTWWVGLVIKNLSKLFAVS
jgi:hypothetical protein